MIIVIRFKYVALSLAGLAMVIILLCGRLAMVGAKSDGRITATFISFLPMVTPKLTEHLSITSTDPRQRFESQISAGIFRVQVLVREKYYPKGYPITIQLNKVSTWVPGIKRSFRKTAVLKCRPEIWLGPGNMVGTRAPLRIAFTTPLRVKGIARQIMTDFPAKLVPYSYRYGRQRYTDYATWMIIPLRALQYQTHYRIVLKPELEGVCGKFLDKPTVFRFKTVSRLRIESLSPASGSAGVSLLSDVEAIANRRVKNGKIQVGKTTGRIAIHDRRVSFNPERVWLPNTVYRSVLRLVDQYGESAGAAWQYRTEKLKGPVWVEVNLPKRFITVFHEQNPLKSLLLKNTVSLKANPERSLAVDKRGYAVYSKKANATAFYWLRMQDGTLIHSEFYDAAGKPKPDSVSNAISFALRLDDVRWLYQSIPLNAPVMVHGGGQFQTDDKGEKDSDDLIFFNYKTDYEAYQNSCLESFGLTTVGRNQERGRPKNTL